MGSIERFFGVLLEHYAGAFPPWLAPIQVAVLPVASEHGQYAMNVISQLEEAGFRCEFHRADNPLGKRIRDVKTQKIPYVLVAGSDDVSNGTVGVNPRGSEVEIDVPLSDFVERLQSEVDNRQ